MARIISCDRSYLSKEEALALDGISKDPLLKIHMRTSIGKYVSKAAVKKQLERYILAENEIIKTCGRNYLSHIRKEVLNAGDMEEICIDLLINITKKAFISDHNKAHLHGSLGNGSVAAMIRIINNDLIHREDTVLKGISGEPIYINGTDSEWNNISIESLLDTSEKTASSFLIHNVIHNDSHISIKIPAAAIIKLYQSITSVDDLNISFNYNVLAASADSRGKFIEKYGGLLEEAILAISKMGPVRCKSKCRVISPNTIWRSYDISIVDLFL